MEDEGFKRKLSAILIADVKGYSRLMGNDEEATVRTLTTYRTAISDLVQQFRGRVVDSPGDNILAEFPSIVDAVNCAVEIQRELTERNSELPDNRKMEFRIGINLGDVIEFMVMVSISLLEWNHWLPLGEYAFPAKPMIKLQTNWGWHTKISGNIL